MTRQVLVLEHTPRAGLSAFTEVLDARRTIAPWSRVLVPSDGLPPVDLERLAGLLVMGGTMSAVDPLRHPWMPPELGLLRDAVDAGIPVLGVSLGAQLLGGALGGRVTARAVPEVAYLAMHRTAAGAEDPLVAGWPEGAAALMIHEDEVTGLPPGAVSLLTGSDGVPAWRCGSAWAVQFHPEVTGEQFEVWLTSGMLDGLLRRAGADVDALLEETRRRNPFTRAQGRALVGRFLDGPVRERAAA